MRFKPVTYHELIKYADDLEIPFIPWKSCKLIQRLGDGASMNVFSGTYKFKNVTQKAAFKIVNKTLDEKTRERNRSNILRDIRQEVRIMGLLKGHSRIVQLLGVSFDNYMPVLIQELAKSNLEEYLQGDRIKWKIKLGIMYDVAVGLGDIHKAEVVHGDLKAANILIYDGKDGQIIAKISDFGFSSTNVSICEGRLPGFSMNFRSRECFDPELSEWNGKHTTDVYSYGLLVYQIANDGTVPFEDYDDLSEIDDMKIEGTEVSVLMDLLSEDAPMEVREIITATVRNVPSDRATLDDVKNILMKSTEWDQVDSEYQEAKSAFEGLASIRSQESITVPKMNTLSIPPPLKNSIFLEYQRESDAGDLISLSRLGSCFYYGFGTEKDYLKSFECYSKAAESGDGNALNCLGAFYDTGNGVTKDPVKAFELYAKAAEAGNIIGQYNLGLCYYHGHGIARDYFKAVEFYTKAAEAGDAYAQNNLGACYGYGRGVPKDTVKALEWYKKAADAGDEVGKFNVDLITPRAMLIKQFRSIPKFW